MMITDLTRPTTRTTTTMATTTTKRATTTRQTTTRATTTRRRGRPTTKPSSSQKITTRAVVGVTLSPPVGSDWRCAFESSPSLAGLTWCSMEQSDEDDFDWTMTSAATPSKETGPTRANSFPYYIYIEASKPPKNAKAEYVWRACVQF